MGVLRLLLALLVGCSHLGGQIGAAEWYTGGAAIFAVKAFFVMSGFYMALIISTRYRHLPTRDFYASRGLRLLPTYWFITMLTALADYALTKPGESFSRFLNPIGGWRQVHFHSLPVHVLVYIFVSLTTLLGANSWDWLGFNPVDGRFSVAPAYAPGATSALMLVGVPQAWSIGIELLFYLIAPFLVLLNLRSLVAVAMGSLLFRFVAAHMGFDGDPWSRALFPSELIYFVGGVVAYREYVWLQTKKVSVSMQRAAFLAVLIVILTQSPLRYIVGNTPLMQTVPFILLVALIPLVFTLSSGNWFDTFCGNLSYPFYMVHLLVYALIQHTPVLVARFRPGYPWLGLNLALVVIASVAIEGIIMRPVERLRRHFGARVSTLSAPANRHVAAATQ
jgi:peptidoglycan/LPS O-acetylase OafA/YrhL